MSKFNFLQLDYSPCRKREIIAEYYVGLKKGTSLEESARKVAAESSVGTWTELQTLSPETAQKLGAKIFSLDKEQSTVKIAYPVELFEGGSISQLMSSVGGNVFGMSAVDSLRLNNLSFPDCYVEQFPGPQFGVEKGSLHKLQIKDRPVIGSIIKPKIGLTCEEHSQLAYQVFRNGVDLIKDDENLTSLSFNKFKCRVDKILQYRQKAEKETGSRKMYVFNITGPVDTLIKRAELVESKGGRCVMVDIITTGWSAVRHLRNQNFDLLLHGHRAGHAAFTRKENHGISMLVIAKLARLAGIDQLHTGTVVGKMVGDRQEVTTINDFLNQNWAGLKKVLPVSSGGLHPGLVPQVIDLLGSKLVINFGGGIHGHPDGSAKGARAVRQAIKAVQEGISLEKKAQNSPALKKALNYWQ